MQSQCAYFKQEYENTRSLHDRCKRELEEMHANRRAFMEQMQVRKKKSEKFLIAVNMNGNGADSYIFVPSHLSHFAAMDKIRARRQRGVKRFRLPYRNLNPTWPESVLIAIRFQTY